MARKVNPKNTDEWQWRVEYDDGTVIKQFEEGSTTPTDPRTIDLAKPGKAVLAFGGHQHHLELTPDVDYWVENIQGQKYFIITNGLETYAYTYKGNCVYGIRYEQPSQTLEENL
jgi:hypothetical protein